MELVKKGSHGLLHTHAWLPPKALAKLLIGIVISFPLSGAASAIKYGWQLPFRPSRIRLPEDTERPGKGIRHPHRSG